MLSTLAWLTFIADLHNYHSFYSAPGYLTLSYIKQPLGNLEWQLLHMSYSHTQHTWVFERSHAYLLCHYSISSNPSGTPSGNCFTCLTHIPSTPGYSSSCLASSVILLIQATPREPRAAIRLALSPDTPGYSSSCSSSLSLFLIQATPPEPRAAIASHDLLTLLTHLGILPHAYLLYQYF